MSPRLEDLQRRAMADPEDAGAFDWWVSCRKFTCWVRVEGGRVTAGAPILRRFWLQRQSAKALGSWMRSLGGFRCARLKTNNKPGSSSEEKA